MVRGRESDGGREGEGERVGEGEEGGKRASERAKERQSERETNGEIHFLFFSPVKNKKSAPCPGPRRARRLPESRLLGAVDGEGERPSFQMQGHLAHKKQPPPRTHSSPMPRD